MVQDTTGMWETPPATANQPAGSVGPGELPQVRVARQAAPWPEAAVSPDRQPAEAATGHILNGVA